MDFRVEVLSLGSIRIKIFKNLLDEFRPDAIFVDRQRHFGLEAAKTDIPLLVHLRGNYWAEMNTAKETLYKSFPKNIAINKWEEIGSKCFENSKVILPICKYLENIVKEHYPRKPTSVLYQGIEPEKLVPNKWNEIKTSLCRVSTKCCYLGKNP